MLRWDLTEEGVDEAVPHAAARTDQPPSPRARGEAERRPEHADKQVAHRDAHEHAVDRWAQRLVTAEQQQHERVVQETKRADETETQCDHHVSGGTQIAFQGRVSAAEVGARGAASAQVGRDHYTRVIHDPSRRPLHDRINK